MVYAREPLQGIVKRNKVLVKKEVQPGRATASVRGVSSGKEMAGSVTKLEQQRERNPHVQSGFGGAAHVRQQQRSKHEKDNCATMRT